MDEVISKYRYSEYCPLSEDDETITYAFVYQKVYAGIVEYTEHLSCTNEECRYRRSKECELFLHLDA